MSVRELADNTSRVVREVSTTGRPRIITNRGVPVAAIIPIDVAKLEDFVLATAPEFVRSTEAADRDLDAGDTLSLDELSVPDDGEE